MNYLLTDLNSVGRAAHSSNKLTVGDMEVQAIFNTLQTLRKLLKQYPQHKPVMLNDGRAQWRFDLFPLYKGNRANDPKKIAENEAYHAQKPWIIKALISLGVTVITDPHAEADDLAGYFSRKLAANSVNKITLVTGDADWKQLVTHNVDWQDHRDDSRYCNHVNFKQSTGFDSPSQFVEAKCLMGDTSDNVPGVGSIGEKGAVQFFTHYKSVNSFFRLWDENNGALNRYSLPSAFQKLASNEAPKDSSKYGKMPGARDAFERNLKLMLLDNYAPNKTTLQVRGGPAVFCKTTFKELAEDLAFRSMLVQLDNWIEPFEKLRGLI